MIRLPDCTLDAVTATALVDLQATVDSIADFAGRVAEGKRLFTLRNKQDNATFRAVRSTLTTMCQGAARCSYCEDSARDQVEHIRPKDFYPEQVFLWENYLYACGRCNRSKLNKWAVFDASQARFDIHSPQTAPIIGEHIFLDPRRENPLDFLDLDLRSFIILPRIGISSQDVLRVEYTLEILGLNDRDELLAARDEAYRNYIARLEQFIKRRDSGENQISLDKLVHAIQRMSHQMVWQEMKRQHTHFPELNRLFAEATNALSW